MDSKISISLDFEVPFFDVDSYRVVWHGSYVKYFEVARCKLLEHINYTYDDMERSGYFFPVVDLQIRYIKPLRFRQKVTIIATLHEWECRLVLRYLILDQDSGQHLTKGKTVQAAVSMSDLITQFSCPDILINNVNKMLSVDT
ncbi:MAG: acyl-CoA thioesterase [Gammaproteobacteria bacterium]|nr:acyl-CoA thioesterase [Gammaproteobacteria bacterium]